VSDGERDHSDPRPAEPDRSPAVVQLGSAGRAPIALAAIVGVFLIVAIVKPWPGASGPGFRDPGPRPTPTVAASIDPLELVRRECQEPRGWRTYSQERWSGGTLHSWTTLEPVAGQHDPLEPGLPTIPYATEVLELGFCVPYGTDERPPEGATVKAWRIEPATGSLVRARAVPLALTSAIPGLALPYGAMFRAPVDAADDAIWPVATYAFQVATPGGGYERWWAIEIDPPLHPIRSADPTAGASDPAASSQPVP
jgi:hypothetical protein